MLNYFGIAGIGLVSGWLLVQYIPLPPVLTSKIDALYLGTATGLILLGIILLSGMAWKAIPVFLCCMGLSIGLHLAWYEGLILTAGYYD